MTTPLVILRTDDHTAIPAEDETFMLMAHLLAEQSTCPAGARHAALAVRDGHILASGVGKPDEPCDRCYLREKYIATGIKDWTVCPSIHAEIRLIEWAAEHLDTFLDGATLYVTKQPCERCDEEVMHEGFARIVTP